MAFIDVPLKSPGKMFPSLALLESELSLIPIGLWQIHFLVPDHVLKLDGTSLRVGTPFSVASMSSEWYLDHLFLQFGGTNKLRITSVMYQDTVDTIRERVLAMWPEGVIYQTYRNEVYEFHVQFSGNPWTAKGALGLMCVLLTS